MRECENIPESILNFMKDNREKPAVEYKTFARALRESGGSTFPKERRSESGETVEGMLIAKTYAHSKRGGRLIWCHILTKNERVSFPVFHIDGDQNLVYDEVRESTLGSDIRAMFKVSKRGTTYCTEFECRE